MKNILEDNYISIEEAAVYLGIKAVTLRTWIKIKKDLPAHKIGKQMFKQQLALVETLEKWIIDFENRIESSNISDVKKLMFLLIVFGSGRNGSQYSVETLGHYFNDVMVPLSKFALENKTTITKIIENNIFT